MTAPAAAAAAPTWQELWRRLPQQARDFARWRDGASDDAALAAWQRWLEQALAPLPSPILICPSSRR